MATNNAINNNVPGGLPTTNTIVNDYTLVGSDATAFLEVNKATGVTITIPTNASVPIAINTYIPGYQKGLGQVTFTAAVGATIIAAAGANKTALQNSPFGLFKVATNTWLLTGDITT